MRDVTHVKMFLIAVAVAIPAAAWADSRPDPECVGKAEGDECRAATTCASATLCDKNLHCSNGANPINNNEPCESDNDACTQDKCDGGKCHHNPISCDDGNACTVDGCDQSLGCQYTAVVCDDHNPCTVNSCNPAGGCDFTTPAPNDCAPGQCGTSACGYDCGSCSLPCVPQITCPAAVSVECVSGAGANTLGTATATCDAEITNDGADSYDFTCGDPNSHDVTYTATNGDGSAMCTATLTVEDTAQPTNVTCDPDVTVNTSDTTNPALTGPCEATITPSASGTDACEGSLTGTCVPVLLTQTGPGTTTATCTVADCSGNSAAPCRQSLKLVDDTPPTIICATPYITPPRAPMSWTASSVSDNCGGAITTKVTGVDCYLINGAGKKVSKLSACKATYSGNTVSVGPSAGGVGTIIQWTVSATDGSSNTSAATCYTQVQNPGLSNP